MPFLELLSELISCDEILSVDLIVGEVEFLLGHSVRRVFELGRRLALLADEGHQEDVLPENDHLRHPEPGLGHLDQVPHLLLRPHEDDFARILFAKPVSEPPVILGNKSVNIFELPFFLNTHPDVFVPSFELIECGFKHL